MTELSYGYVVGGAIPLEAACYASRAHDDTAFGHLVAGRWVVLLGPRQHGKTSSLIRLRKRLDDSGIAAAVVDLQAYGKHNASYSEFLEWVVGRMQTSLGGTLSVPVDAEDLEAWLQVNFPGPGSTALLLDEVSAVPADCGQRFFSQLRAIYNARAMNPNAVGNRIVVLFAGTFRPEQMIETGNSPFNVSVDVATDDLSLEDTCGLAATLGEGAHDWGVRTFTLTEGQPYLTQYFLDALLREPVDGDREVAWERAKEKLMLGSEERHLPQLFAPILNDDRLAAILRELAVSGRMTVAPTSRDQAFLQVLGVAKVANGAIVFRNSIYADAAESLPQLLAGTESTVVRSSPAIVVAKGESAFASVSDEALRRLAIDAYVGGVNAYMKGDHRLALIAFGSALEAILLDFLESLPEEELRRIAAHALGEGDFGKPGSWKLVRMIEVAHKSDRMMPIRQEFSDAVRDWRNVVNPDKARREFQNQHLLEPDARITLAICDKVLGILEAAEGSL